MSETMLFSLEEYQQRINKTKEAMDIRMNMCNHATPTPCAG